MNQRDDTPGNESRGRGRESNGGREFYPGSHGFDDTRDRSPGSSGSGGRERSSNPMQSHPGEPQGQYEREARDQARQRSEGGHDPRYDQRGSSEGRSESDRYRPVTEEWEAARGYGGGADEGGYAAGQGYHGEGRSGGYGESRYGRGYGVGRYGRERAGETRFDEGRDREGRHGYGGRGAEELGHGAQGWYGERGYGESRYGGGYGADQYGEGHHGESRYGDRRQGENRYGRYSEGRQGEGAYGEGRYREGRYGAGGYGEGRSSQGPYSHSPHREGQYRLARRYGWEAGASQPYYGPRAYGSDRPWQDQYGFGQRTYGRDPRSEWSRNRYEGASPGHFPRDQHDHEHSSEQLFDREPFARNEEPRYYGTGAAGWGGPGFTGGAYGYGSGARDHRRSLEDEYSDESAVSYEQRGGSQDYGRYGPAYRNRPFARGPKGYQRSDERLKEDISERLMEAHHIDSSEVTVDVRGAKVILEGVVPSRHMKHAIEDLVDACPGVQDIENRVRVASPNYQGTSGTTGSSGTTSQGSSGVTSSPASQAAGSQPASATQSGSQAGTGSTSGSSSSTKSK